MTIWFTLATLCFMRVLFYELLEKELEAHMSVNYIYNTETMFTMETVRNSIILSVTITYFGTISTKTVSQLFQKSNFVSKQNAFWLSKLTYIWK